ncbi:hypothetical protein BLA29_014775 [Euroglyphus maynei]|uniref:Uncharacterized protein n=1 Tax=Euroglyphus maynei TaxID=6958 RepID=A0A1Y3BMH2_EURMA|nr:hypothetical protein BLA29_014775 [Euroglyphus maynei]
MAPSARNYVRSTLATINWTTPEGYGYLPHCFGSMIFLTLEWLIGWKLKMKILGNIVRNSVRETSLTIPEIIRSSFGSSKDN